MYNSTTLQYTWIQFGIAILGSGKEWKKIEESCGPPTSPLLTSATSPPWKRTQKNVKTQKTNGGSGGRHTEDVPAKLGKGRE